MIKANLLTRHLKETGENYFEHFLFAFTTALWLGLCCLILLCHSIFPFLFTVTTSRHVTRINQMMQQRVAVLMARRSKVNVDTDINSENSKTLV